MSNDNVFTINKKEVEDTIVSILTTGLVLTIIHFYTKWTGYDPLYYLMSYAVFKIMRKKQKR